MSRYIQFMDRVGGLDNLKPDTEDGKRFLYVIDEMIGLELDKLTYDLKIAPKNVGKNFDGWVMVNPHHYNTNDGGGAKPWNPSLNIDQAITMFYNMRPGTMAHVTLYVGASPADNMNSAEVLPNITQDAFISRSEISLALALTRACCKVAFMNKT